MEFEGGGEKIAVDVEFRGWAPLEWDAPASVYLSCIPQVQQLSGELGRKTAFRECRR